MRVSRWLTGVSVVLCACGTVSVYPFYTPSQAYMDSTLLGGWSDSTGSESATFVASGTQYDIVYQDHGKRAQFVGTLFRLGRHRLLDVTPGQMPESAMDAAPDLYWSLLLPGHAVLFLDWTATRLAFANIEPDSIKSYVRSHPGLIRHFFIADHDSTLVLDGLPAELQRFVLTMARRPHVLADSAIWARAMSPGGT